MATVAVSQGMEPSISMGGRAQCMMAGGPSQGMGALIGTDVGGGGGMSGMSGVGGGASGLLMGQGSGAGGSAGIGGRFPNI